MKIPPRAAVTLTGLSAVVGTPQYMAPESILDPAAGRRYAADVAVRIFMMKADAAGNFECAASASIGPVSLSDTASKAEVATAQEIEQAELTALVAPDSRL